MVKEVKSFYEFTAIDDLGNELSLANFKAKCTIVVNFCLNDPRVEEIANKLYCCDTTFRKRGFHLLTFPCSQFSNKTEKLEDFYEFAKKPRVTFGQLFKPIDVNGPRTPDCYKFLKKKQPGGMHGLITQNYTIFFLNSRGYVVDRIEPPYHLEFLKDKIDTMILDTKHWTDPSICG